MLRNVTIVVVVAIGILAYVAWTRNTQKAAPEAAGGGASATAQGGMPPQMPPAGSAGGMPPQGGMPEAPTTSPGVKWDVPRHWTDAGAGTLRLATYSIPGTGGAEGAQCAVYYFGPGQGGTVDANLERWSNEFKNPSAAEKSSGEAHGMKVWRINSSGIYLAHSGMMGTGTPEEKADWSLLGAIVDGPNGFLFFKLTGPSATVKGARGDFDAMIKSAKKG
jgi:hypothetical protein